MKCETWVQLVRILIKVINPAGVEAAGAPLDSMHCIALLKQQLREVTAVLAGDTGDQGSSALGCDLSHSIIFPLISGLGAASCSGGDGSEGHSARSTPEMGS